MAKKNSIDLLLDSDGYLLLDTKTVRAAIALLFDVKETAVSFSRKNKYLLQVKIPKSHKYAKLGSIFKFYYDRHQHYCLKPNSHKKLAVFAEYIENIVSVRDYLLSK